MGSCYIFYIMKKLLLFAILLASLVSCTKDIIINPEQVKGSATVEITDKSATGVSANFTNEKGSLTIHFKATDKWTATAVNDRADGWVSFYPTSGEKGEVSMVITANQNDDYDGRTATVTLTCGDIKRQINISQKQKDAITLTSSKFEVGQEGGQISIEVKSNVNYTYTIDETAKSWLKPAATRGLTTSTVALQVDQNENIGKREGGITFTDGTLSERVTVYQEGYSPEIIVSTNRLDVTANGGVISVDVKSNLDVSFSLEDGCDWVEPVITKSMSTNTYKFNVKAYSEVGPRATQISFYNDEFSLTETVNIIQHQGSIPEKKDGVTLIQKATVGKGVNLVVMGDMFTQEMIDKGDYEAKLIEVSDGFFAHEPYHSLRNMFNVYVVDVPSEMTSLGHGALRCDFGDGTYTYGDDEICFGYAKKAIKSEDLTFAVVLVILNYVKYAGTCFMYYPVGDEQSFDYSPGKTIAYFPIGKSKTAQEELVSHEAGGHGFTKLGDEYYYSQPPYNVEIPASDKSKIITMSAYGWYSNIDFTNSYSEVKWSKYIYDQHPLYDARYESQKLGIFQGANVYMLGVYRPSDDSMMRNNHLGFNAPSREAIYYKIHKVAYGDTWQYDHAKFVEFDLSHPDKSMNATKAPYAAAESSAYEIHLPPVLVGEVPAE